MVLLNHYSTYDNNSNYRYTKYSFGEIDLKNFMPDAPDDAIEIIRSMLTLNPK